MIFSDFWWTGFVSLPSAMIEFSNFGGPDLDLIEFSNFRISIDRIWIIEFSNFGRPI